MFADFVQFAWNPTLVEAGRRDRRLADPRDARSRRRPSRAPARRRLDRRRHAAHADHAGDRALSGEPARPARRLPGLAAARLRARAAHLLRRARRGGRRSRSRAAPRSSTHHATAARPNRGRARRRRRARATTSRTTSSETSSRRSSGASPSPRRCRTSNGSSRSGRAGRVEDDRTVAYTAQLAGGRPPF